MGEPIQERGEDRRRVVKHYRRGDERVRGSLILRPAALDNMFMGGGLLCLLLALIIEVPFLGWEGWNRIGPFIRGVPGWWLLGLLLLSMVIQAVWLSTTSGYGGQRLLTPGWGSIALLSVPILGWLFWSLRRHSLEGEVSHRPEPSGKLHHELVRVVPGEQADTIYAALGLPLLASVWGVLWLILAGGMTGWYLLPIGLFLTALHGGAAIALGEYLSRQLRERAAGSSSYPGRRALGLWAWLPAPLAIAIFAAWLLVETRPTKEQLSVHHWRLGSASVSRILGASSRSEESVEQPRMKGSSRHEVEIGSFCRLQSFRLFFEGYVMGCLGAPIFLDRAPWQLPVFVLVLALPMTPITWVIRRLCEVTTRAAASLRPFLAIPRLIEVSWLFIVGILWGSLLWSPPIRFVPQILMISTGISGTLMNTGFLFAGRSALDKELWAVVSWSNFGFFFSMTCAFSPLLDVFVGRSIPFGVPIPHLLVYLAATVAAGGFAVALYFIPWLLKPARWQDLRDPQKPLRHRLRILAKVVAVMLPFSGLLNPLWQSKIDRHLGPASR